MPSPMALSNGATKQILSRDRGLASLMRHQRPRRAMNNLAKRIKRVTLGITNWTHWRIRVLLCAGHPGWPKLATITPATP